MMRILGIAAASLGGLLAVLALGWAAWAALGMLTAGQGERPVPYRVVIGLDVSVTSPLVRSQAFAAAAGDRAVQEFEAAPPRSVISLRTFGDYSAVANPVRLDRTISARQPLARVQGTMEAIIAGVPQLIADDQITIQEETHVLGFLENMAAAVNCDEERTVIVLVTAGLETSARAQLTQPGSTLPEPAPRLFENCDRLVMLGLGQGLGSPREAARVREAWAAWSREAGFLEFVGLNDW